MDQTRPLFFKNFVFVDDVFVLHPISAGTTPPSTEQGAAASNSLRLFVHCRVEAVIISSGFKGERLMNEEILATMNSFRSASLVFSAFLVSYSACSYML